MRIRKPLGLLVALSAGISLILTGCASGEPSEANTLRMAVTELQGLEELQREFGAFEKQFEKLSGYDLEFFPVSNRTAAAVALNAGQVDLVFTGPAEYVALHARTEATPVVSITRPGYRSVIYTTSESGVTSLADLRGRSIAMDDVGSTSGHLGPAWILSNAGLDPMADVKILNVGDSVHQALKRGDVSAVGIVYYAFEDYTRGENPATYRVLAEGDPLPPDVILARKGLGEAARSKVKKVFVESWNDLLPALLESKLNARYSGAQVVETNDGDYDIIRKMYRAIGVDDFANTPE